MGGDILADKDRSIMPDSAVENAMEKETKLGVEETLKDAVPKEKPAEQAAVQAEEENIVTRPIQMKSFSFRYFPHVLDHLAYSGDRNLVHLDPIHVKQVLLSLEAQATLHKDRLRFDELKQAYSAQGKGNVHRKELLADALRLKIREFGPKILGLDHPIIFPGAESVAYLENIIPSDDPVCKVTVTFMNPLLLDLFRTSVIGTSMSCTEYPRKGMKEYRITADGDLFGEKVRILEMGVTTFNKDAGEAEEKFIKDEFGKFVIEESKDKWAFNGIPVLEPYHESLLVSQKSLTDYLRSVDMNGASKRPEYVSPFAMAALLPRLLIMLADKYRREHSTHETPEQAESEKKRFALVNEYVSREKRYTVLDSPFEERVNDMMGQTLRIYNSQSGIFSRRMRLKIGDPFNLAVFLTKFTPRKGKFDFVAEARQGWKWPWKEDNRVFVGAGDALEQPLYNEIMMEYVLEQDINIRTMKPFGSE